MSAIGLSKNWLPGRGWVPIDCRPLGARWQSLQRRWFALDYETRFQYAVAGSMLLHLFVLFGITIRPPDLSKLGNFAPALEIVLVNAKSKTRPQHADTLAQHNLDGGAPLTSSAAPRARCRYRATTSRPPKWRWSRAASSSSSRRRASS
jgi:hypothetical protein